MSSPGLSDSGVGLIPHLSTILKLGRRFLRNEAHLAKWPLLFPTRTQTSTASLLFEWPTPAHSACAQPQRSPGLDASSASKSSRLHVKLSEFLST